MLNTWTTGRVSRVDAIDGQFRIARVARHDAFDRVVFEFADGVPSFSVRYVSAPVYEGTNAPVEISGTVAIEVTFHFYYGENTDIYQGYPKGKLDLPVLREIKDTDGFEGVMTFVLGLQGRHEFRVSTLSKPARLVVDIKH
jgi:hypothetical protein